MSWWIFPGAAAAAGAICLGRSSYEKKCLTVTEYAICPDELSPEFDGMKIVFLTDLHDKQFGNQNERLISAVDELSPDLVLIGGDMMVARGQESCSVETAVRLAGRLAEKYPVYYGYGNHELRLKQLAVYAGLYRHIVSSLRERKVRILDDSCVTFHGSRGSLTITGITLGKDTYPRSCHDPLTVEKMEKQVGCTKKGDVRILLAHNPLYQRVYADWGADLTLSGHYHGGTVIVPFLGGLMSPDYRLFPKLYRGEYETDGKKMIVSGGLGTHSVNIRLGNKPEVVFIRLKAEKR